MNRAGDLKNSLSRALRALRAADVPFADVLADLKAGHPAAYITLIRRLLSSSRTAISQATARSIVPGAPDRKVVVGTFDLLRDLSKFRPAITVEQFMSRDMYIPHKLVILATLADHVQQYGTGRGSDGRKPEFSARVSVPSTSSSASSNSSNSGSFQPQPASPAAPGGEAPQSAPVALRASVDDAPPDGGPSDGILIRRSVHVRQEDREPAPAPAAANTLYSDLLKRHGAGEGAGAGGGGDHPPPAVDGGAEPVALLPLPLPPKLEQEQPAPAKQRGAVAPPAGDVVRAPLEPRPAAVAAVGGASSNAADAALPEQQPNPALSMLPLTSGADEGYSRLYQRRQMLQWQEEKQYMLYQQQLLSLQTTPAPAEPESPLRRIGSGSGSGSADDHNSPPNPFSAPTAAGSGQYDHDHDAAGDVSLVTEGGEGEGEERFFPSPQAAARIPSIASKYSLDTAWDSSSSTADPASVASKAPEGEIGSPEREKQFGFAFEPLAAFKRPFGAEAGGSSVGLQFSSRWMQRGGMGTMPMSSPLSLSPRHATPIYARSPSHYQRAADSLAGEGGGGKEEKGFADTLLDRLEERLMARLGKETDLALRSALKDIQREQRSIVYSLARDVDGVVGALQGRIETLEAMFVRESEFRAREQQHWEHVLASHPR